MNRLHGSPSDVMQDRPPTIDTDGGTLVVSARGPMGHLYVAPAAPALGAAAPRPELVPSEDQQRALDRIMFWFRTKAVESQVLRVGGYAGTGKTTVIAEVARLVDTSRVAFCAFAGKAAAVLRAKLARAGVVPSYCGTMHALLYHPDIDPVTGAIRGWRRRRADEVRGLYDIIIVDEASMVGGELWTDTLAIGLPVLAVGDHGQLPPFSGPSLMVDPDVRLEHVHRQAEGDPIIALATAIRRGEPWQHLGGVDVRDGYYDTDEIVAAMRNNDAPALCRYNATRAALNAQCREGLGDLPEPGEPMIVLRSFGIESQRIYNGARGLWASDAEELGARVTGAFALDDDRVLVARFSRYQLGMTATISNFDEVRRLGHPHVSRWEDVGVLADYAYAMTVHKAQGSEWPAVVVVEQRDRRSTPDLHARWLYTAVTRASERLVVFPA